MGHTATFDWKSCEESKVARIPMVLVFLQSYFEGSCEVKYNWMRMHNMYSDSHEKKPSAFKSQ